ncbi:hypothetical protein EJ03DRAFT_200253 [Teratosphaeria nubilosa]|uniref:Uncharacterized protein n=1 Tax=Teratosphaeria nubilosa TaxID=161662 RepID=A0A6G1LIK3_9PEZI|nr:hypothetical protein EJ03DRAFT_200253 [Teratosphaeria nubilosa]
MHFPSTCPLSHTSEIGSMRRDRGRRLGWRACATDERQRCCYRQALGLAIRLVREMLESRLVVLCYFERSCPAGILQAIMDTATRSEICDPVKMLHVITFQQCQHSLRYRRRGLASSVSAFPSSIKQSHTASKPVENPKQILNPHRLLRRLVQGRHLGLCPAKRPHVPR